MRLLRTKPDFLSSKSAI